MPPSHTFPGSTVACCHTDCATLNTVYKPQLYTEIHHGEYQGGWIECRARRISLELLLVVLQTPIRAENENILLAKTLYS